MHMSLIKNFQKYGNNLTELEIECFNKLLTFRDLEPSLTISSLAETLNVSTTTIFRMVKKLDYKTLLALTISLMTSSISRLRNISIVSLISFSKESHVLSTGD